MQRMASKRVMLCQEQHCKKRCKCTGWGLPGHYHAIFLLTDMMMRSLSGSCPDDGPDLAGYHGLEGAGVTDFRANPIVQVTDCRIRPSFFFSSSSEDGEM